MKQRAVLTAALFTIILVLFDTEASVTITEDRLAFGTTDNDFINITANTLMVRGLNGSDVYYLTETSPTTVRIDNIAIDDVLDTLDMSICSKLVVLRDAERNYAYSINDAVLICKRENKTDITVIILNYYWSSIHMHLKVKYKNKDYMIVPETWLPQMYSPDPTVPDFIFPRRQPYILNHLNEMISFKDTGTSNFLFTWQDKYPILYVSNKNVSFTATQPKIEDKNYFNHVQLKTAKSNVTLTLDYFFVNGNQISNSWRQRNFIIISDDRATPRILSATKIALMTFK